MVDRLARNALIVATERFLRGETTSFEFDDERSAIDVKRDALAARVSDDLWCFYDDLDDHYCRMGRVEWNYIQRLLLLLKSDRDAFTIETTPSALHPAAAFVWAMVLLIAPFLFAAQNLFWPTVMLWFVSGGIMLHLWLRPTANEESHEVWMRLLAPFCSLKQLAQVHARTPAFQKQRYPKTLATRILSFWNQPSDFFTAVAILIGPPVMVFGLCRSQSIWYVADADSAGRKPSA